MKQRLVLVGVVFVDILDIGVSIVVLFVVGVVILVAVLFFSIAKTLIADVYMIELVVIVRGRRRRVRVRQRAYRRLAFRLGG